MRTNQLLAVAVAVAVAVSSVHLSTPISKAVSSSHNYGTPNPAKAEWAKLSAGLDPRYEPYKTKFEADPFSLRPVNEVMPR